MAEKNKIYTAADFERYHSGIMPFNEMHELEKAALEDPFLADALEGYAYTPSFENDITELRERLNEKQKNKNVFSISSFTQSGWWRIAALFIIIAGGGYFFYRLNYKDNKNALTTNEIKLSMQKKDSTIGINDTASSNNIAFENHQSTNDEQKKIALPKIKPNKETSDWTSESDSIKFNMTSGKNHQQSLSGYALKGKVTDENGKPIAFATGKNKSKNEAVVTDTTGRFSLPSADSNTTAIVSVVGYDTKKVALQKDKEPTIAMDKNSSNLDEVTVIGYGQNKKIKDTASMSKELNSKVSGLVRNQATSTLSNNEKFNDYLEENTKPVYDADNNQLTGEVLLSFTINKKGRPHNIKVVKSSCGECEAEAIRLLENGPDWTNKKQKRETVSIKF